jgi:hypothetical protein
MAAPRTRTPHRHGSWPKKSCTSLQSLLQFLLVKAMLLDACLAGMFFHNAPNAHVASTCIPSVVLQGSDNRNRSSNGPVSWEQKMCLINTLVGSCIQVEDGCELLHASQDVERRRSMLLEYGVVVWKEAFRVAPPLFVKYQVHGWSRFTIEMFLVFGISVSV